MAKAGFWLSGARGQFGGASLSQSAGGATILRVKGHPSNPQTAAQVKVRARFKILSQIGAALDEAIGFKREGERSPRNVFASVNYPATTDVTNIQGSGADGAAVNLAMIKLTKSNLAAPTIEANDGKLTLQTEANAKVTFVIAYCKSGVYSQTITKIENLVKKTINATANAQGIASVDIPDWATIKDNYFIYAYAYIVTSDDDKARYDDYYLSQEDPISFLKVLRGTSLSSAKVTDTMFYIHMS